MPAGPADSARKVERAAVNGVELEYEVRGTGEPVVLIHWGVGVVRPEWGVRVRAL